MEELKQLALSVSGHSLTDEEFQDALIQIGHLFEDWDTEPIGHVLIVLYGELTMRSPEHAILVMREFQKITRMIGAQN